MKTIYTGTQSFQRLIEGDCLYVDKTRYIYNILRGGMAHFLSLSRRFAKSLLINCT
ncbi:MAG: AAA family ATPase [Deltaproteobacteria bacterium]|nr:AAA family ATPase [Deltaproteobacteria bacterium]